MNEKTDSKGLSLATVSILGQPPSSIISSLPWLFLLIVLWYFALNPEPKKISDLIAGIYLKLTHTIENDEKKTFQINKIGLFESEITHPTREQEKIKNSKLLSTSFQIEDKQPEDNLPS